MPVFDIEPGQSPEAPGTMLFYRQGADSGSGFRATADGEIMAPNNSALTWPVSDTAPSDHGMQAWAYDPAFASGASSTVNGTLYLTKIPVRKSLTLNHLAWSLSSGATTPTAGRNWVGIYDVDGDLLNSAGVDAESASAGAKITPLPVTVLAPYVWAAFLFTAATPPSPVRCTTFASTPNINLNPPAYRFCINGTGLTSLPSSIVPANNSLATVIGYWAGLV